MDDNKDKQLNNLETNEKKSSENKDKRNQTISNIGALINRCNKLIIKI